MSDNSELKEPEKLILESEKKFKSLFNGINLPVFVHQLNPEGFNAFMEVNDTACQRYGYSKKEFLNLSPKDISSIEDAQQKGSAEGRRKLKEEGQAIFEATHITKNGEKFPVEISSNIYNWLGQKVILSIAIDITERKQTEKELSQAYTIINRSPSVAFLWRNEEGWPVDFVSENVEKLFGYSVSEFKDKKIAYGDIIHNDDLERVIDEVSSFSIVKGIETFTHEPYRIVTKKGEIKWLSDDTHIRRDSKGIITHYEGIVHDITEQKQVERALVRSENRYRAISKLTSDYAFAYRVEPDGTLVNVWVTGAFVRLTGYSRQELESLGGWPHLIYPGDMSIPLEQFKILLSNQTKTIEYRIITKDGQIRWMRDYSRPTWSEAEKRVTYIEGAIQDITERKLAEDALRESEAKYRQLIEDSNDAIYLLYNCRFEIINAKFTELFGITLEHTSAPEFNFINLVAPESRSLVEDRMRMKAKGSQVESKYEFKALNHMGKTILVEISVNQVKYKEGVATQGILRDITQKRQLEQQLQQSQKMEAIGALAGGIAHDFNNILTVINGYSELALLRLDKENHIYNTIESILQAGRRAGTLTSQLLAFSRKQIYKADIVEINSVIREMDKLLRRLISENINIDTLLGENLFKIKADKSQLEQIFINLVVNARDAIDAVKKPGHKPKITIETGETIINDAYVLKHAGCSEGPHVFISVSDNGIGMDEDTQQKIFEPFFSTKDKSKGTGLGLATVYGIVKQNNGSIYVYSEPDQGTTFKIYWPATSEKTVNKPDMRKEFHDLSGNESILFVEDDNDVSNFAFESLTSLGYSVFKAENGRLSLELFKKRQGQFDIIVTDLVMPELNGKEFVKRAKKIKPDIKVIYVSGYTDNHIVHNGMLEKGVNFIQKPYSVETLAGKIRQILDSK